jgi:hypothetical protein
MIKSSAHPLAIKGAPLLEKQGGDPSENKGDKVYPSKSITISNKPTCNKMSKNVEIIELSKCIKNLEDTAGEYKGVHRGETAGGECHWDKGTKEKWRTMRNKISQLKARQEALLME